MSYSSSYSIDRMVCGSTSYSTHYTSERGYSGSIERMVSNREYSGSALEHNIVSYRELSSDDRSIVRLSLGRQYDSKTCDDPFSVYSYGFLNKKYFTGSHASSSNNFIDIFGPVKQFVKDAKDIEEPVKETFKLIFNKDLPKDISIHLLDEPEFNRVHSVLSSESSEGVVGFALNKFGFGVSEIFVKKDRLDRVMCTIGHEIGHILSRRLSDSVNEEAKAFAFEVSWVKTIKKHNILGLDQNFFIPEAAVNGIHNVAFDFVKQLLIRGLDALSIFNKLVLGEICVFKTNNYIW